MADLHLALIHYPVLDRTGRVVTSAITSLDLHDIARSARTYGVRAFFVVHPIPAQREFARGVIDHWRSSHGRSFDSRRLEALELIRIVSDLDEAAAIAAEISGAPPELVFTSARARDGVSFQSLRERFERDGAAPLMLMLGTGFGLTAEAAERAQITLAPILGRDSYNHLSVRAAAAIMLDRLRGGR